MNKVKRGDGTDTAKIRSKTFDFPNLGKKANFGNSSQKGSSISKDDMAFGTKNTKDFKKAPKRRLSGVTETTVA